MRCVGCIQKVRSCARLEAEAFKCRDRTRQEYDKPRNKKFKAALQAKQEDFPGISRTGARHLVRQDLHEISRALGAFVARKLRQLMARVRGIE